MSKPEYKGKCPPVTEPDDILDPVARFHAQQLEAIREQLSTIADILKDVRSELRKK